MRSNLLKELKVLLVEDEPKLAMLLKNAIADSFYSFVIAKDGEEGLQKFSKLEPDIVITDIMMPRMTGLEMAKKIKETDPDVPIIILSAFSETDNFLNAIDVGVVKYFIKPFDPDELLEYIEQIAQKLGDMVIELKDDFSFSKTTNNLYKNGRYVSLTKKECQFIHLLLKDAQKYKNSSGIVDDKTIKNVLWEEEVSDERLRTFIRRLRAKTSKSLIDNIKGEGYTIVSKTDTI